MTLTSDAPAREATPPALRRGLSTRGTVASAIVDVDCDASAPNIFGAQHDIWSVNVEAGYHEERSDDTNDERSSDRR